MVFPCKALIFAATGLQHGPIFVTIQAKNAMAEKDHAADYLGTRWRNKDTGVAYSVIGQTGRDKATPQNVADSILTMKTTNVHGQKYITVSVEVLSKEFEFIRNVPVSETGGNAHEVEVPNLSDQAE